MGGIDNKKIYSEKFKFIGDSPNQKSSLNLTLGRYFNRYLMNGTTPRAYRKRFLYNWSKIGTPVFIY